MLCMAGFVTLHLSSVYVCVCVCVDKISQKVFNHTTLFWVGDFPVTQGGND